MSRQKLSRQHFLAMFFTHGKLRMKLTFTAFLTSGFVSTVEGHVSSFQNHHGKQLEPHLTCDLDGDRFICQELYPPSSLGDDTSYSTSAIREQCCVSTMPLVQPDLDNCGGSRPIGLPFAGRSPIFAQQGMAATSQPLTTQAALDILKQGGNAVEAAIAANAMEGVVEPMMCGLGGDLMAIVWDPKTGKLKGINSSGRASKSLSYDAMKQLLEDTDSETKQYDQNEELFLPTKGPLSISVPGAAAGWCYLFDRFSSGNLTLAEVSKNFYENCVISFTWINLISLNHRLFLCLLQLSPSHVLKYFLVINVPASQYLHRSSHLLCIMQRMGFLCQK